MSIASSLRASATPQHRWALWLALLLALIGALAPTVSRTLNWARGGGVSLVEVCTSSGPRWMAWDPAPADSSLSPRSEPSSEAEVSGNLAATALFDACPFCLLLADRSAPPPPTGVNLWVLLGTALAPQGFEAAPLSVLFTWMPPPRGPPHRF